MCDVYSEEGPTASERRGLRSVFSVSHKHSHQNSTEQSTCSAQRPQSAAGALFACILLEFALTLVKVPASGARRPARARPTLSRSTRPASCSGCTGRQRESVPLSRRSRPTLPAAHADALIHRVSAEVRAAGGFPRMCTWDPWTEGRWRQAHGRTPVPRIC